MYLWKENNIIYTICYIYMPVLLGIYIIERCGATDSSDSTKPEYIQVFAAHKKWSGTYTYNKTTHDCMLFAHSEHYLKKDGLLVTFKDREGATIEMEGEGPSSNELEVVFSVHVMFDDVKKKFPLNFTFHGTLSQKNDRWFYYAVVTIPANGLFGNISVEQYDKDIGPYFDDEPPAWRYVIIIGIPILLAVVGVGGTIGLFYWAIKRGYIRHVPKNYDSFDNPVSYNKQSVYM